ncbi:hypothetical protein JHK85_018979 [Glycine max]|nr:hypothetical protein JHK85_018979 [Glycine max]KAG5037735.1 hypothetical protein JHK86_018575 [Glycine max]
MEKPYFYRACGNFVSCPLLCNFASRALYCFQPPLFDEAPLENSKNTEKTKCSQCTPSTKVSVTNKVVYDDVDITTMLNFLQLYELLRDEGVKVANIGHTKIVVFEKLVHVILDPEEGDIGSGEKGDEGIWRI